MKLFKFVLFAALWLAPMIASAQVNTVTAFSSKAFAKATTREDTSATFNIGGYPYACYQMTSTGTDSAAISTAVDAYINGVWVNTITTAHTFQLGRPAGHVIAGSAKGQVDYVLLRSPATTTIDILGGAYNIRLRNKFSAGAGDSNAVTAYTQKLILRKP